MTRYLTGLPHLLPFAAASVLAACGGDPSPSGCVRTISKDVTSTTAWAPDTTVEYAGALTVEPGVRLQFEAESGLRITETGSLVARGTAEAPIVFTGRTETPGYWKGISILS
ncbi:MULTISPECIES: hypothetical protein [unclassified Corallococcus]|uniref:hypothetical protein n=1 Tax=unclassified Corallococcus TaxID=2685029 RepID=UPI001A8C559B|nr:MULTISPECIES: hypothetical protein [unclassified Corallococcus]MBN9682020.1 hypothetical protein [Corallococcus sp. NCSPR001]WAS86416.1 hypothetical protein O0N60_05440 [Corallococcus sp. NCRR]